MAVSGRGRRDLKRLLNEAAVPAFARKRLPLLYCNGELVAVANLPQLSAGRCALNGARRAAKWFELIGPFR